MNIILYCFIGVTAVVDIIRREIPGWMFLAGGIVGVVGRVAELLGKVTETAGNPVVEVGIMAGMADNAAEAASNVVEVTGNMTRAAGNVVGAVDSLAGVTGGAANWQILGGIAASMAVGGVLLVISHAASGEVGAGDGWFFTVTGLYVPWYVNLGLLCYGLVLCCIYGSILTAWGVVKGISVRKKKIPFLPFVAAAGVLMRASQLWQL